MVDEVTYEAIPFRVNGYNGRFRVELLPVEANPILLYVNSNEYPIESSPFKITVQNPSPPKVIVTSKTLNNIFGNQIKNLFKLI